MTTPVLKQFMAAIHTAGIDEDGMRHLIYCYTDGRTDSRKDLNDLEGLAIIASLSPKRKKAFTPPPGDHMRKKIIAMAREIGWEIEGPAGRQADMARLNAWCKTYGHGKKRLNAYTLQELPRLVAQFERVYLTYMKK